MIRTARMFTARGVLIAAINHAPGAAGQPVDHGCGTSGGTRFW
jgi:hypothetical protein